MSDRKVSIKELIDGIEHTDQLNYAKKLIEEKLKKHYNQERKLVWEVSNDRNFVVEFFEGQDYSKAIDFLCQKAIENSNWINIDNKAMSFKITSLYWLESEYNDYFS